MRLTRHTLLTVLLFAAPIGAVLAEEAQQPSIALNTLNGLNSALNGANGFLMAYQGSGLNLAAMANQLQQVQMQASGLGTQQNQFDQIRTQLMNAMVEAQNCMQGPSMRTYEKFTAKRSAKQKRVAESLTPDALLSAEPTCETAAVILDSIALNKAKMEDTNKKMACITNLQNSVNTIAERTKVPFQALTDAAGEVYKTHTQIIDAHKRIADQLSTELDGKDGKGGGYRDQLRRLKQMSLELNNVLNAKPGGLQPEGKAQKEGLSYGLVKKVEDLARVRALSANKWYFTLMNKVEACYQSRPASCFDNDINLPPSQCVAAMFSNQSAGSPSAGKRVAAKADLAALNNINEKNHWNAVKLNLPTNIDIGNPDQFLGFTKNRFSETLKGVLDVYRGHSFTSNINKNSLTQFVGQAYQACYDEAAAGFKADIQSKGSEYYNDIVAAQDNEREVANDLKNWIDRVEGEMSEFRTSFHKVYNNELAQFKTDCTAAEDPYKNLDCLKVLGATLDSGIKGTNRTTKLSNGSTFSVNAGETTMPMQTLTLDSAGKPSISNTSAKCSGFDDCINYMDRTVSQHSQAAQKGEEDRGKFVEQHNNAVKTSFSAISGQFGQMSQLITAGVTGVNQDLAKLGIKAQIKTKQIDAEELKENEKTGMIDMPKSMKAALAGRDAYTEIEPPTEVTDAYNSMTSELAAKAVEASKMRTKCLVDESSYKRFLGAMPSDCSKTEAVCGRDKAKYLSAGLENLFRRSKATVDDDSFSSRSSADSDYRSCVNDVEGKLNEAINSDNELQAYAQRNGFSIFKVSSDPDVTGDINDSLRARAANGLKQELAKKVHEDIREQCTDYITGALEAEADGGRGSLRQQNLDIVGALKNVTSACAVEKPDADEAEEACEGFKKAVNAAKPPEYEEPTSAYDDSNKAGSSLMNPLTLPNSGTAK